MRRLLLWDLDGTVVHFHGATLPAFAAAVTEAAGRPVDENFFDYFGAGMTDPMIAREALTKMGFTGDDLERAIRRSMQLLGKEMAKYREQLRVEGEVLPGVREVLDSLENRAVFNTVVTGNIAVNAVLKLDVFHLTKYFDLEVGGFGNDAPTRPGIAEKAIERVSDKRNKWFNEEDTWIIGDTPRDAEVAEALELRCLLVATGRHTVNELSALRADVVLEDLTNTAAVVALLSDG